MKTNYDYSDPGYTHLATHRKVLAFDPMLITDNTDFIVAMEMTTTEVLEGLLGADVTEEELTIFQHFLDQCDLVKFAKVIPTDRETVEVIQMASDIIDRTKVIITEPDFEEKSGKIENGPEIEKAEMFDESSDTEPVAFELDEKKRESSESGGGYT